MNLSVPGVVLLMTGVVLAYAAVNNKDPRDVIREAMNKKPIHAALSSAFIAGAQALPDSLNKPATLPPAPDFQIVTV